MSQEERRATFILKKQNEHPNEYNNPFFKFMVDYTILFTKTERMESFGHVWDSALTFEQRDLLRREQHVA